MPTNPTRRAAAGSSVPLAVALAAALAGCRAAPLSLPQPPGAATLAFAHLSQPRGLEPGAEWTLGQIRGAFDARGDLAVPAPELVLLLGELGPPGTGLAALAALEGVLESDACAFAAAIGPSGAREPDLVDALWSRPGGWHAELEPRGELAFLALATAVPGGPAPCLDAGALAALERALAGEHRPLVVACAVAPDSPELPQPSSLLAFMDAIDGGDVALLLHAGTAPGHRRIGALDLVSGGDGPIAGYGASWVEQGALRSVWRSSDRAEAPLVLLEKPLRSAQREVEALAILAPADGASVAGAVLDVEIEARFADGVAPAREPALLLDGVPLEVSWARAGDRWRTRIAVDPLPPGAHLVTAECEGPTEGLRQRTSRFFVENGALRAVWHAQIEVGIAIQPLPAGAALVVAAADGSLRALERTPSDVARGPRELWRCDLGSPIVRGLALSADTIVALTAAGAVVGFDALGERRWIHELAGRSPAAALCADRGRVLALAADGSVTAIDAASGAVAWTFDGPGRGGAAAAAQRFGALAVVDTLVAVGASDGSLLALDAADGSLRWRAAAPAGSALAAGEASSGAGPTLAAVGGALASASSGGALALHLADGSGRDLGWREVSAVAAGADGASSFLRLRDARLVKLSADRRVAWRAAAESGRFQLPPVEAGGVVWTVGDRGVVSALDASTGARLGTYRATVGSWVFAPPCAAGDGTCYVAGVDGSVTALRAPLPDGGDATAAAGPGRIPR
jgi:outer membrane protein assembly factor BamB